MGGLALDGLLGTALGRTADADLDLPRLRLFRLLHVDLEDTVLELRRDGVLLDALWQADGAREGAEAEVLPILHLVLARALGRDRQRTVLELDGDLVLGDTGQVERVDDLVLGFPDVDGRDPALRDLALLHRAE